MRKALSMLAVLALGFVLLRAGTSPRADGPYVPEHARTPAVTLRGDSAWLAQVRAFRWEGDSVREARWTGRALDLRDVRRVWYALSPFASWRGPAHAFLSFEFADGTTLAVSVEARREEGEHYSPLLGMLQRYELILVIGEERDVVGLRTHAWGDPLYLYPARATPEQARALLETLLRRAEQLRSAPEHYHTLTNNCATNLVDALNAVSPGRAGWTPALLLPGYSDDYAWKLGLLDLQGPPAQVRERYRVDPRGFTPEDPAFSERIRGR